MDEETKNKYVEAGKIAQEARRKARELTEPGAKLLDIAEGIEGLIRDRGAKPAFPVNISIDEISAHYTPDRNSDEVIKKSDVVKVDIGAHVDGYIADTALTINPDGDQKELVEASEEALRTALEEVGVGKEIGEIGEIIQEKIESQGFKTVRNLGGHFMERWTQHAGDRIPNIKTASIQKFEDGDVIAIEPFASRGSGKVKEGAPGNIYRYLGGKARKRRERKLLKIIESNFKSLPFTTRWIDMSETQLKIAVRNLVKKNILHSYSILREVEKNPVSQAEHTILIREENIVTTRE